VLKEHLSVLWVVLDMPATGKYEIDWGGDDSLGVGLSGDKN